MPNACSPTAFELPSGDEIIFILFFLACLMSIFSIPDPTLAINFKLVALSIKTLSIGILLLMIIPW